MDITSTLSGRHARREWSGPLIMSPSTLSGRRARRRDPGDQADAHTARAPPPLTQHEILSFTTMRLEWVRAHESALFMQRVSGVSVCLGVCDSSGT